MDKYYCQTNLPSTLIFVVLFHNRLATAIFSQLTVNLPSSCLTGLKETDFHWFHARTIIEHPCCLSHKYCFGKYGFAAVACTVLQFLKGAINYIIQWFPASTLLTSRVQITHFRQQGSDVETFSLFSANLFSYSWIIYLVFFF